jgi:hypothetical protein
MLCNESYRMFLVKENGIIYHRNEEIIRSIKILHPLNSERTYEKII